MKSTSIKTMNKLGKSAAATALLVATSSAFAQPSVNGYEISWPDDGWYQVQRSDNYESICNGGSSCVVTAGRYTVINHSTGVRFRVDVVGDTDPEINPPTQGSEDRLIDGVVLVSGNTLSWPNDGWYQVQNTEDNSELCAGVSQCQVAPGGTYRVINHSTGQRFGPIELGAAIRPPVGPQPAYSVEGNQVSWFYPGWHQLQNAVTYQSVCEGPVGTVCIVTAGIYKLINHSTNTLYRNIEVLSDSPVDNFLSASPVNLTGVAYTDTETEIFWEAADTSVAVVGYDIVRNGTTIAQSLDALSYYDNLVAPGSSYEYQVIAVDSTNRRSSAATVMLETPAAYTTINADNYLALSRYLFSTAKASFTTVSEDFVDSFSSDELYSTSAFSQISSRFDSEFSRVFVDYSCEFGGTYINSPSGSAAGGEFGEFDQCAFADMLVNGRYDITNSSSDYVFNPGLTQDTTYNLMSSSPANSPATEIVGTSSFFGGQYMQVLSWNINRYMSPSFNGMTLVTDFISGLSTGAPLDEMFQPSPYQSSFTSNFSIQSPETGNKPINYSTTETLMKTIPEGGYETGRVSAVANDGSSLSIDFNTGNPDTANITVEYEGNTFTESLQVADYL